MALHVADYTPTDDSKRSATKVPQEHLSVPEAKAWRVQVWLETKDCFARGEYRPWRGNNAENVRLPPIMAGNVAKLALETLRPLTRQQLFQQQQQQQQRQQQLSAAAAASSHSSQAQSHEQEQPKPSSQQPASKSISPAKAPAAPVLKISLYLGDCGDAARDLYCEGYRESVLMMDAASSRHAGGGTTNGSRAQEEELCRRSSLLLQLDNGYGIVRENFYPLNGSGVLVPQCTFIRASAAENYAFLPKPFTISVGAVAAPNEPGLTAEGNMDAAGAAAFERACRTFFRMASANGIRSVVPIALGCGAFRCPAHHAARIMAKVIVEEYVDNNGGSGSSSAPLAKTCVEEVRVAIFEDHNSMKQGGVFVPFGQALLRSFGDAHVNIFDSRRADMKFMCAPSQQQQAQNGSHTPTSKAAAGGNR